MGRLFDAVAALAGMRGEINYEGQAAIEFEALADPDEEGIYPFEFKGNTLISGSVLQSVIADIHAGTPLPVISARFHNGLANIILEICQVMRREFKVDQVALSGGVWQNMTLLKKTIQLLNGADFAVYTHRQVPPNDGGLALGQAAIAVQLLKQ
jgi:hydrogenase maturation protein HypF